MTGLSLLCSCLLLVSPVFVSVIFYFTRTTALDPVGKAEKHFPIFSLLFGIVAAFAGKE